MIEKLSKNQKTILEEITREKAREKTREKTREKILNIIKINPDITTEELAAELQITTKGIEWQITKLKKKRLLRRIGPDKGGHWETR